MTPEMHFRRRCAEELTCFRRTGRYNAAKAAAAAGSASPAPAHEASIMRKTAVILVLLAAGCTAGCQYFPALQANQSSEAVDHYAKGQLAADKGDYDAAMIELKKAIAADPKLAIAQCAVGDIYRKKGELEMARFSYESAAEANPYSLRPQYYLGVVYQALAEKERKPETITQHLQRAVRAYLRALTIRERDFDSMLNLGACYFQMGKFELAEQYCKAAVEFKPDSAAAHSNLGVVYDAQGRLTLAIHQYKLSLECNGQQPMILLNLGSAYLRGGAGKDAVQAFEAAARLMPKDAAPVEQIGSAWFHLAHKAGVEGNVELRNTNEQKSIDAYKKAIEMNPESAAGYCGLGAVYMAQHLRDKPRADLRDKALAAWRASLDINPHQKDLAAEYAKYNPQGATSKPARP